MRFSRSGSWQRDATRSPVPLHLFQADIYGPGDDGSARDAVVHNSLLGTSRLSLDQIVRRVHTSGNCTTFLVARLEDANARSGLMTTSTLYRVLRVRWYCRYIRKMPLILRDTGV
jgi:hypothetical protein